MRVSTMEVDGAATPTAPTLSMAAGNGGGGDTNKIDMVIQRIAEHRAETRAMDQEMHKIRDCTRSTCAWTFLVQADSCASAAQEPASHRARAIRGRGVFRWRER